MAKKQQNREEGNTGLFKGIFVAYFILILHVLLIGGVGCLIFLFKGVISNIFWIAIGCSCAVIASGGYFYKRMKEQSRGLGQTLNSPAFRGRSVEVSILGGLASFRVGAPMNNNVLTMDDSHFGQPLQLEDPAAMRIRRLTELAYLLEKDLITREEYNQTKEQIFHSN